MACKTFVNSNDQDCLEQADKHEFNYLYTSLTDLQVQSRQKGKTVILI